MEESKTLSSFDLTAYGLDDYVDKLILYNDKEKFKFLNKYKVVKYLGHGSYGTVYRIVEKDGTNYAMKLSMDKDDTQLNNEYKMLSQFKHDNIITVYQYYSVAYNDKDVTKAFIMEYLDGGSLQLYIDRVGKTSEVLGTSYFRQILSALAYLHKLGYVHGDIKPQNMVIDQKGTLKLIDFGTTVKEDKLKHGEGTIWYRAPEDLMKDKLNNKIDIWAAACVFIRMLSEEVPFAENTEFTMVGQIYNKLQVKSIVPSVFNESDEVIATTNKEAIAKLYSGASVGSNLNTLLLNVLAIESRFRYSAQEALDSTYIKDFIKKYL